MYLTFPMGLMRRQGAGVAAALASTLVCALPATAATTTNARKLSSTAVKASSKWRSYVVDPQTRYVYPKAVTVEGNAAAVSDPSALTRPGGVTTIRATGQGAPRLVLDLGVNTGGIVQATVTAGSGMKVRLAYSESRRFLTPIGDTGQNSLGNNDEPFGRFDTFTATPSRFASPATRGGQRWVLLQLDGAGTVSLKDVRVRVQHLRADIDDYSGHFLSNDNILNRAWYASAYTFDASTTGDTLVVQDGAKRDRMVFAGDLGIAELVGLNTVRQGPQVIRNSLRLISCQPELVLSIATYSNTGIGCPDDPADALVTGPLPSIPVGATPNPLSLVQGQAALPSGEYVAWYVQAAETYYQLTGDGDYMRKLLPVLRRGMSFLGLLEIGGLYYAPLDYTWRAGLTSGQSPYTNTIYFAALRSLATLERDVGKGAAAAASLDAHAETVRKAVLAKFLDPATGALLADPSGSPGVHLQDANVMAPYMGLLNDAQSEAALAYVAKAMSSTYGTKVFDRDSATAFGAQFISPFMSSWELLARLQRRQTTAALGLIRRTWGLMARTDPNTTVWEKISLKGEVQPNQPNDGHEPTTRDEGEGYVSLAHAWSGGPVPALSGYVLGARATSPGFDTWVVSPQVGDLRWAQGQVPTPAGPLVSRWVRDKRHRTFRLTVTGPPQTSGNVEVPLLGASRTIARDGRIVWRGNRPARGVQATRDGDVVRFAAGAGTHTYAWGRS